MGENALNNSEFWNSATVDKLVALRAFVEVAHLGSLTKAGEALGKSPPTMVRVLAALEQELGTRLLHRTTRRCSLTEEGRLYLERARRVLVDLDEADRLVAEGGVEPRGEVRITAPVEFGRLHVAPAVRGFLRRYPRVGAELLLLDRPVGLVEEGIDLAVRIGKLDDSSMIARRVGKMRRVVCASPELIAAVGAPRVPADLRSLPCVGITRGGRLEPWPMRVGRRPVRVKVEPRLRLNQIAAAVDAVVDGIGYGNFLEYQVRPWIEAGQLRVVLPECEPAPRPIHLLTVEAAGRTARVRLLLDWLSERLVV